MSETPILGALTQQPLHPRLAEVLRRIQAAEKTATGAQRRPTFRLMREVLSAAIELGVPAKQLAECLGSNTNSLRNRAHGPDGTMSPELIRRLTDLTPDELDRASDGALNRDRAIGTDGAFRTADVVRALLSIARQDD
jgi:hypothetical protein